MRSIRKLPIGTRVRVKEGVTSMEFPEISMRDWKGVVRSIRGKRYMLAFDDKTLGCMPTEYISSCEERQMIHRYALLEPTQVEAD